MLGWTVRAMVAVVALMACCGAQCAPARQSASAERTVAQAQVGPATAIDTEEGALQEETPVSAPEQPGNEDETPDVPAWAKLSTQQIDAAKQLGIPVAKELDLGGGMTMRLVLIPPGEFMMGSPESEDGHLGDEGPVHAVGITSPFYMGICEVTNGQYMQFRDSGADDPAGAEDSYLKHIQEGQEPTSGPQQPVIWVSWNNATAFTEWLSTKAGLAARLPTEAEWEYACRAGSEARFSYGDDPECLQLAAHAWYDDDSAGRPHPVAQLAPNGWGLYDMHGNVWEWCSDWYGRDYYAGSPQADPPGPSTGQERVLRGGSWYSMPQFCRSAARLMVRPAVAYDSYGFRVVVAAPGAPEPGEFH